MAMTDSDIVKFMAMIDNRLADFKKLRSTSNLYKKKTTGKMNLAQVQYANGYCRGIKVGYQNLEYLKKMIGRFLVDDTNRNYPRANDGIAGGERRIGGENGSSQGGIHEKYSENVRISSFKPEF